MLYSMLPCLYTELVPYHKLTLIHLLIAKLLFEVRIEN